MNFRILWALTLRYLYLYKRNWIRVIEMIFWPLMNLFLWGFLTIFLSNETSTPDKGKQFVMFLLGAMMLWDILFRSQQAVSISFLEDVWTKNLLNIFVAPVRLREYVGAGMMIGIFRVTIIGTILVILGNILYAFDLLQMEYYLIPFVMNLLIFGWGLGMITTALILRFGQAAEALAWAIPFLIQPIAAVFYPVSDLPPWLQIISWLLPCTHVFEGMRTVLLHQTLPLSSLGTATALNIIFLLLSSLLFSTMFRHAQNKGLLAKVATQ